MNRWILNGVPAIPFHSFMIHEHAFSAHRSWIVNAMYVCSMPNSSIRIRYSSHSDVGISIECYAWSFIYSTVWYFQLMDDILHYCWRAMHSSVYRRPGEQYLMHLIGLVRHPSSPISIHIFFPFILAHHKFSRDKDFVLIFPIIQDYILCSFFFFAESSKKENVTLCLSMNGIVLVIFANKKK